MFRDCQLGLKPHDPARVARVKAFPPMPQADPRIAETPKDWAQGRMWDPDDLGNRDHQNCVPAACINVLKLIADVSETPRTFTAEDALNAYRRAGWDGTPATDGGVVMLDFMQSWTKEPIGGVKLDGLFAINFKNYAHLATALYFGGPLVAGFTLTESCQNGDQWNDAAAADERVLGGHAVMLFSASPGMIRVKTWGLVADVSPGFMARRCNEVYLPLCRTLHVPSKIDWDEWARIARLL
jgi:hypothetical protein